MPGNESDERVIVIAPVGQDAAAMAAVLHASRFHAEVCSGAAEACRVIAPGAGALLLTEEALEDPHVPDLLEILKAQPPWSELPLIILTSGGESRLVRLLDLTAAAAGSLTVLERPIGSGTLLRSVQVALSSRRRQYQVRDLLERLQTSKQEAETARREAEAASQAKDDFIAALSHELRTPLSPVLMTAADLENDEALSEEARAQLRMIRRNIELEARLIDDLLDLTRIRRGMFQIDTFPSDVHELLQRAEEIVRSDMQGKAVALDLNLGAGAHHVMGDPARLQQVFWNLIKNGLKFTGSGGRVTVRTSNPAPDRIAVVVQDTGIGIAPWALQRIFHAFDQGELTGRHRFGGLGLGLSISKAIVEEHHGELRAASEGTGKGASFTVELDVIAPVTERRRQEPAPEQTEHAAPLRLLFVEDHRETLAAVVRLLEREGHRVFAAGSVAEALAVAAEHECDVVISDLGLPDGTGLALMREIKQRYGWPGIALSGYGMPSDVKESKAAGFVTHLVKPVNISMLRQAIRDVADRNRGLVPACSGNPA